MATNNKTASGVPKPLPTDEIDVVDIQGIADKVEETIQNIESHLAETASDDVHGLKPVLLFSGNVWQTGTIINLTDNKQNYSRLDFVVDFSGIETRTVYHKVHPTHALKSINLSDSGDSTVLVAFEMLLEQPSDTTFKIRHNFRWSWTGSSASNATINPTNNNAVTIYRIYGYK